MSLEPLMDQAYSLQSLMDARTGVMEVQTICASDSFFILCATDEASVGRVLCWQESRNAVNRAQRHSFAQAGRGVARKI
jgi:hypothetical protein